MNNALRVADAGTITAVEVDLKATSSNALGVFAQAERSGWLATPPSRWSGLETTAWQAQATMPASTVRWSSGTLTFASIGMGTRAHAGGMVTLDDSAIVTTGAGSHGLYAVEANSSVLASNVQVETTGDMAYGVASSGGGAIALNGARSGPAVKGATRSRPGTVQDTVIHTTGLRGRALSVLNGSQAELHNVAMRTEGAGSNLLYSHAYGDNVPSSTLGAPGQVVLDPAAISRTPRRSMRSWSARR